MEENHEGRRASCACEYAVENVPIPEPGFLEVLVEIRSIAICGSDPGIFAGNVRKDGWPPHYPFIAGHEFAGRIAAWERRNKIPHRRPGGRRSPLRLRRMRHVHAGLVQPVPQLRHGRAPPLWPRDTGLLRQYQKYHVKALTALPENVSYDEGAMADTAGTAYNGLRLLDVEPGGYTAVIGPGPMGVMLAQMAKAMGSRTIILGYHDAARLTVARKAGGAHVVVTAELPDVVDTVRNLTGGRGADRTFDCAGSAGTLENAVRMTCPNGKVGVIAYPKQPAAQEALYYMVKNQITVQGVRANPNCSGPVLQLISQGAIDASSLITHSFGIDEIELAFDVFTNHRDGAVKVVIHPND